MLYVIFLAIGLVLGIIIGVLQWLLYMKKINSGTIRVADDGEDQPYLFLELKKNPEFILDHKYVVFKVNPDKITPRK